MTGKFPAIAVGLAAAYEESQMAPPLSLPPLVSHEDVARQCRDAYLHFLNHVCVSGKKGDLVAWLSGPYRLLIQRAGDTTAAEAARIGAVKRLDEVSIRSLLAAVREEVVSTVADRSKRKRFAAAMVQVGYVVRCVDQRTQVGWIPRARPNMRLADRVLSLVAVDYLIRHDDHGEEAERAATMP
jgi:hypothetical protein